MDITESTVSSILKAQIPLIKDYSMNSNFNDLFTLTDYERDTSKLLAINTQIPNNAGVAFEMEALGFGGEVFGGEVLAEAAPSMSSVKVDKTDWENMIR